jgi:hypothetical protein
VPEVSPVVPVSAIYSAGGGYVAMSFTDSLKESSLSDDGWSYRYADILYERPFSFSLYDNSLTVSSDPSVGSIGSNVISYDASLGSLRDANGLLVQSFIDFPIT